MKTMLTDCLTAQGACAVGTVRARKFDELYDILKKRGRVSLCESDEEKRINPFLLMPEARSIIVCLFSYCIKEKTRISRYAMGKDYHIVVRDKMNKARCLLEEHGYKAMTFADNGPLSDRHLAYLAGLGFFGKNGMLINELYGSMVFIGYILTDCEIQEDKPLSNTYCMRCNKCISACPAGALGDEFGFNEELCVSYLTQKKGVLSEEEEEIIRKSGYVWGCDICQSVCPYNEKAPITNIEEFKNNLICESDINTDISNREFKRAYGDRAFSWRGKGVLERNKKLY